MRFVNSRGNLLSNKDVIQNKTRGVSKGNFNSNININTNKPMISQTSKKAIIPNQENRGITKSNNYNASGAKFNSKQSNYSGKDMYSDVFAEKELNFYDYDNKPNIPIKAANNRSISSSKFTPSKQTSNHINKSNLNPVFSGPPKGLNNMKREFEERPIAFNKSKIK